MSRLQVIASALTFFLLGSSPVSATILRFNLSGTYTVGAKTGQTISATISYDDTQTATIFAPFSNANENYYIVPAFTFTNAVNMPTAEYPINIGVQDALNSSQQDGFIFNLSQISFNFFGGYQSIAGPTVPTLNMLQSLNKTFNYTGSSDAGSGTFTITPVVASVPETGSWAMMTLGMGAVGHALRRRGKNNIFTKQA